MKRPTSVLLLTLIALAGCRGVSGQSLDSLRAIKIERQTLLPLGGKLPAATDFCDWDGATCNLKPGTFSGTKKMSFSKTESGLISQFHFDYGLISMDAVKIQIDDFIRRLGKPSRDLTTSSGELEDRKVRWSDSTTTFEYSYKTDRKQAEAAATLSDNALAGTSH